MATHSSATHHLEAHDLWFQWWTVWQSSRRITAWYSTSWYISDTLTANNMVYLEGGQTGHGQLVQGLHLTTWHARSTSSLQSPCSLFPSQRKGLATCMGTWWVPSQPCHMAIRVQRFLNLDDIYPSLETCGPI